MNISQGRWLGLPVLCAAVMVASMPAAAQQQQKPNILFIIGGWMRRLDAATHLPTTRD